MHSFKLGILYMYLDLTHIKLIASITLFILLEKCRCLDT